MPSNHAKLNACEENTARLNEAIQKYQVGAYFSKEDIENLRKDLFEIQEYHNEGGKEQKNWHVLTLRKIKY